MLRALKGGRYKLAVPAAASAGIILLAALLTIHPASPQTDSSLLQSALRQELGLSSDSPIPRERLKEIEQLTVCGETVVRSIQEHQQMLNTAHDRYAVQTPHGDIDDQDLALLSACTNLRVLILDYQQITDLSPLAGLPLEYLSLTGNEILDPSPLEHCPELRVLDLGENPVRSAAVAAQLSNLREATFEATGILSAEAFASCGLQSLNLRTAWVTDYTPLESCTSLTRLVLGELPEGAAETLSELRGLEELRLYSSPGVDLTFLSGWDHLQELDLYGSSISHPEILTGLKNLRYLNLGETGLQDLSFLPAMPVLQELDLRENPLSDLTPLLDCPWLNRLILSPRHQPLAQQQLSQASFVIDYF